MKECKIILQQTNDILVKINNVLKDIEPYINNSDLCVQNAFNKCTYIISHVPTKEYHYRDFMKELTKNAQLLVSALGLLTNTPRKIYNQLTILVDSPLFSVIHPQNSDAVMIIPDNIDSNQNIMLKKRVQDILYGKYFYESKNLKFVYIISNPIHLGTPYKIGMTTTGYSRIEELNTGNPMPFNIHAILFHNKPSKLEAILHKCLSNWHIEKGAGIEFFECSSQELNLAIQSSYPYPYVYSEQGLVFDDYLIAFKIAFQHYIDTNSSTNFSPILTNKDANH